MIGILNWREIGSHKYPKCWRWNEEGVEMGRTCCIVGEFAILPTQGISSSSFHIDNINNFL